MKTMRNVIALLLSCTAFLGVGLGLYSAVRSPMFFVQVVELSDLAENAPVDAQTIIDLAAVPVGKVSLFQLALPAVENRVLANPWIREVRLQKRFPQTLSIAVIFREPQALIRQAGGTLAYVDRDGKVFGRVNLSTQADLPVLSGLDSQERIAGALRLIRGWDHSSVARLSRISSLDWDGERGFRALVFYNLAIKDGAPGPAPRARAVVDFGPELGAGIETQFHRLAGVFRYLSNNSIAAEQIWADSGKKIVVRTAHGS